MKTIILVISLLMSSFPIWGQAQNYQNEFKKNWSYSPLYERKEGKASVKIKQLKRYLWIDQTPVSVAETNFTVLKNPEEKFNPKALSEMIRKKFLPVILTPRSISNGVELNGEWKKINRHIKMDVIKKGDQLIIVTSFIRPAMKKALTREIDELHSLLRSYDESIMPKTSFLESLFPTAYAQTLSPEELAALLNGSNVTVNTNSNVTLETGENISKNWSDTNSNLGNINSNLGNANTNAADANKNWARTNEVINTNWAESNKNAARVLDHNHMAKLSFYSAAGAALGAISMNLAVQGVAVGMSFLYELFTGTKKKKLEWEDFQKAIQSWDEQLSDLVKLEQIVDEFIGAFDFFADKNVGQDYLKNLSLAMRDMRFDRDLFMEKFKDSSLSTACRRIYYNAADELDQKIKEYEKITDFAKKNNISTDKNQNYFCQQLKELQRKILSTETQVQDLRLAILKAENQFYDKTSESKENRQDNTDTINYKIEKTLERREEFNQETSKLLKESFEKERDEWVAQCVDSKNAEGLKIKTQIDNRFLHFFKAKGMCREAFDNQHSFKDREQKALATIEAERNLRKDLKLKNNQTVDVKLSEEQMGWLTRIHMDAYCYQFAHGDPAKVPAKCKDFPELLYSMSLSRGYEKAKAAYDNRCENRYLQGLSKLAAQ